MNQMKSAIINTEATAQFKHVRACKRQYRNASLAIALFLSCFILIVQKSHSYSLRSQHFSSSLHEKELKNKEIARLAFLY